MKKDYVAIRDEILKAVGGAENVRNVSHCMTRLRLQLADKSKFMQDDAEKIPGVLKVVVQNGEYQFVIGQDVASLYEKFQDVEGLHMGGEIEDEAAAREDGVTAGNLANRFLSFIGGTFSPVIPVLVAGGLTGAFLRKR